MEGREGRGRSLKLFRRIAMPCLCSGEQPNGGVVEMAPSNGKVDLQANNSGLQEAELSLQEGGSLHHEVGASSCYMNVEPTKHSNMLWPPE